MKKAVVVQCRLGSTRLKNKALKLIDNKTILEYVLNYMKKVPEWKGLFLKTFVYDKGESLSLF